MRLITTSKTFIINKRIESKLYSTGYYYYYILGSFLGPLNPYFDEFVTRNHESH